MEEAGRVGDPCTWSQCGLVLRGGEGQAARLLQQLCQSLQTDLVNLSWATVHTVYS
jgi:hypothetical protein